MNGKQPVILSAAKDLSRRSRRQISRSVAHLGHVLRRGALLTLHDVELDLLAFSQRLEAGALNRGVVHETILRAAFRSDESESLVVVEPLYYAIRTHFLSLCLRWCCVAMRKCPTNQQTLS